MAAIVKLRIVSGPHEGEEFAFESYGSLVVGRAADVQWRMDKDAYFSRYHFRVEVNPPACWLVDLGSANGVHVRGKRVQNIDLEHGDRIECGKTVFEFVVAPSEKIDAEGTLILPSRDDAAETVDIVRSKAAEQQIGDFVVDWELGRGSMGVVYHGVHRDSGREAAVKLIQPTAVAKPESTRLFLREVQLLDQLRHPRIVEYLAHGVHEGRIFLAMEYLPAMPLRDVVSSQTRPKQIRLACGIMCRVLEALEFAHQSNVVHRDVKPNNILAYKQNGRLQVKLADFGLAKNFAEAGMSSISHENEIRGTLSYMAPEQVINCRYAKPPCDIYAAGVCLYYLLSYRLPFDMENAQSAIGFILNGKPRPIFEQVNDVPDAIAKIIDRALARDPAARFASAKEMSDALLPFAQKP
jgi:hypothetical protein